MPSEKSARSSEKKRLKNRRIRNSTRTIITKAGHALEGGSEQDVEAAVSLAVRFLDKAVTKSVIHRNTAARKKSRLMTKLNASKTP